jgi:hypothetical protein
MDTSKHSDILKYTAVFHSAVQLHITKANRINESQRLMRHKNRDKASLKKLVDNKILPPDEQTSKQVVSHSYTKSIQSEIPEHEHPNRI